MSGGGGKGGSQTSKTEIPQWVEDASQANLARANDIAQIGYTPYYGPDVAAFTPMQQSAFQNTGQAANAFGMAGGGMTGMEGMPQAQDFGGGLLGYSSQPIYQQSVDKLAQQRPDQFKAMSDLFMDPGTPQNPSSMGYTGLSDMFDGGGMGQSGENFQGGGVYSTIGNVFGQPRASGMGGGK